MSGGHDEYSFLKRTTVVLVHRRKMWDGSVHQNNTRRSVVALIQYLPKSEEQGHPQCTRRSVVGRVLV